VGHITFKNSGDLKRNLIWKRKGSSSRKGAGVRVGRFHQSVLGAKSREYMDCYQDGGNGNGARKRRFDRGGDA